MPRAVDAKRERDVVGWARVALTRRDGAHQAHGHAASARFMHCSWAREDGLGVRAYGGKRASEREDGRGVACDIDVGASRGDAT